jgi:hypothetical protein
MPVYKVPYFITRTGYRFIEAGSPEEAIAIADETKGRVFVNNEPFYEVDHDLEPREISNEAFGELE